jgi:hypothetical protein
MKFGVTSVVQDKILRAICVTHVQAATASYKYIICSGYRYDDGYGDHDGYIGE